MNAIEKSLEEIRYSIPKEVLELAFRAGDKYGWRAAPISLDERITASVIRSRVLVDCNLVGGIERVIDLNRAQVRYVDGLDTLYKINKTLTDNKPIVSVLSFIAGAINTVTPGVAGVGYGPTGTLTSVASRIGAAADMGYPQVEANIELVGDNLVVVKYSNYPVLPGAIRVVLANDENLENINPRSYINFSKLVILATKAYIYNKLKIELDIGAIMGGHEISSISSYVDELADSNELYHEFLTTVWSKTAVMNDSERYSRYIRAQISPGL